MLPHPTFVFCGRLQPRGSGGGRGSDSALSLLVTGCHDNALRLWDARSGELLSTKTQ